MRIKYVFILIIIGILGFTYCFLFSQSNNKNIKIEQIEAKNPLERNNWRMNRKGGKIDYEKFNAALHSIRNKYKAEYSSTYRDGGLNDWNFLGPANVGGRIRAIVQNPVNQSEIFIGTSSGGVWRTTNAGNTWNSVDDFLPSMVITQIVYDPQNTNIMYATTGDGLISSGALPGNGILKSEDGGDSWSKLPNSFFADDPEINDIVIDPLNTNRIFFAASNGYGDGAIYLSMDSGISWGKIQDLDGGGLDIKMDPNNNSRIIVAGYGEMWISNDATSVNPNFTEITGGANQIPSAQAFPAGRIEVSFAPSTPGMIYALVDRNNGEIWRSSDNGSTWILSGSNSTIFGNNNQGWLNNVIWVDPVDSEKILFGGIDLFRSFDGGNEITKITDWQDDIDGPSGGGSGSIHADQHVIMPSINFDGGGNRTVYIGNDGGIYKTNNYEIATENSEWISLNQDLEITQLYGGAISSDGDFIIGGSQDNSFYFTTSGSQNWNTVITGDGAYAAINPDDEDIAYANTNNNQIRKTTDGGSSWELIAYFADGSCGNTNGCENGNYFSVNDSSDLISFFRLDRENSNVLLAGAQRLWRNFDSGDADNWTSVKNIISPGVGNEANAKISTINSIKNGPFYILLTGYNTGILEKGVGLIPSAYNWSGNISPQVNDTTAVTDIEVNPSNENEVIVSFGGYNTDNLWLCDNMLSNGSPNWTPINLGIEIHINSVTWHPSNSDWIYVGTDLGIFASEDKGQTWAITPLFGEGGEGPIFSEVSELFWRGNRLCAATFSRGMWESNLIKDKIYVDKDHNCFFGVCSGNFFNPYNTFQDAVEAAGHGSEIIFLSDGTHDEINMDLVIKKRLKITLNAGPVTIE